MRRLLLTSSFSATADRLPAFLEGSPKNGTVAFIPTANLPQRSDSYVQEARQAFTDMGCRIDDLEVSTADPETIRRSLEEDDLIYLSGGNTFFLLQELRRSGAADLIRQQVDQGTPYIGEGLRIKVREETEVHQTQTSGGVQIRGGRARIHGIQEADIGTGHHSASRFADVRCALIHLLSNQISSA